MQKLYTGTYRKERGNTKQWYLNKGAAFLALLIGVNTLLWMLTLIYITQSPKQYTSKWSFIIPTGGSGSNININTIGQAATESANPYSVTTVDPRANYKAIVTSDEVKVIAAGLLQSDVNAFSSLTAKTVDPTSTIDMSIVGNTPAEAQRKAQALETALELRLNNLRNQYVVQQAKSSQVALTSAENELNKVQTQIANFKAKTGVINGDQLNITQNYLQTLRQQYTLDISNYQRQLASLNTLSRNLKSTPQMVSSSFTLQSDQAIQQNLVALGQTRALIASLKSNLQPTHPSLVSAKEKERSILQAILYRASSLMKRSVSESEVSSLLVASVPTATGGANNAGLYNNIISLNSEVNGMKNGLNSLRSDIQKTQKDLASQNRNIPILLGMERDLKVAEIVYTAAVNQANVSKANVFATYPLTQLVNTPSLPTSPSSPKTLFALVGAGGGTLLSILAFAMYSTRKRLVIE